MLHRVTYLFLLQFLRAWVLEAGRPGLGETALDNHSEALTDAI